MKIPLKWLTPVLLHLLSLSHVTLANGAAAALRKAGSVHLVAGFHVGLAVTPQPHDLSLDSTTYFQLSSQEFALPIMPLHLLGKKSWNVYNQDNIAKVKRDEATAAAKEAAEEERMQEIDSERRLQILRGERPRPAPLPIEAPPPPPSPHAQDPSSRAGTAGSRERKKRKRANEDDTDFELRVARDQTKSTRDTTTVTHSSSSSSSNAPLTDPSGHISLFPQRVAAPTAKNAEAELETARKRREYEDQYTMRFSNAAGFKQGLERPWYSRPDRHRDRHHEAGGLEMPAAKDVWRNEDPRRAQREVARVAASDPLAAMKQGAAGARRAERERRRWMEERDMEMAQVLRADRDRHRVERMDGQGRRKRRREDDDDDNDDDGYPAASTEEAEEGLEGFTLAGHRGHKSSRHPKHSKERNSGHCEPHRHSHHRHGDGSHHRHGDRQRRYHEH